MRRLLLLSMAVLVTTAPAIVTPMAQAAPPVVVNPPAPGTCWDLPTFRVDAPTIYPSTSVACTEAHTLETAANLEVPSTVAANGNNSPELHTWLDAQCQVRINQYAGVAKPGTAGGGTRTWPVWFAPTQREWKAGYHWVSCAAASVPVSSDGANRDRLVPVRTSIKDAPGRNRLRTFLTTDYGKGEFVARKVLVAQATRSYPGTAGLRPIAWKFCAKAIGSNQYFWYGPSEAEWLRGWTEIRCYHRIKKG